jgi:integrase/recombinase XerC/integrase/recombinase XerD
MNNYYTIKGSTNSKDTRAERDAVKVLQGFSLFTRDYLAMRGYSQITVDGYWWVIKSFVDAVGNIDTTDIDRAKIGEWFMYMEDKGNTRSTIHSNVSRLRVFIEYLNLDGLCRLRKDEVVLPRKPKTLPQYSTKSNVDSMIAYAPSIRDKAIIAVLFSTALRNSELRNLKKINIIGNEVMVKAGKGLKDRMVLLDNRSLQLLERYYLSRVDNSPYVFVARGHAIAKSTLRYIVAHAAKLAGCPGARPHGIRHGSATYMMQQGAHLRVIQDYLGHSDPKITELYTHLSGEDIKLAHKKIFNH